jgi:hypothetical protein
MWSLFRSKEPAAGPDIQGAIARLSADPSNTNRIALYQALKEGWLFLAARRVPEEWCSGPVTLASAAKVELLTSSAPGGGEALLAFTSPAEVQRRNNQCAWFSMQSRDVLAFVVQQGFSALVLNPSGPWASVSRDDVEKILEGMW